MEMTELMRMPMSFAVSKSFETARMAMPIFVWLISCTSAITSATVRKGVTIVTTFVVAVPMVIELEIQGMLGYCLARPPVTYHMRFCKR